jgi:glycosyltransferase involved in cell wall biosynthesis
MLAESVGSIRNQTFEDWALVIVDDGSPDPNGLDAFAQAYGDIRVVHQERQGLCVARNVGLAHTRSRYVAFADDDDEWMPDKLERQVRVLEHHPEAVACHSQFEVDSEGTTTRGTAGPYDLHQLLRGERFSLFSTMVIRRSDLDACGWFSSTFPNAEDVDLTYRLARRGPVLFCDEVLYRYRRHAGNVTNDLRISSMAALMALDLQRWRERTLNDHQGLIETRRGQRAVRRYWASNDWRGSAALWRSGNRREAVDLGIWTLRNFPRESAVEIAGRAGRAIRERARPMAPSKDPDVV